MRPPAGDLIRFLAYTGVRWGEATALRCGDVDLADKRIHVRRTHVELSGRLMTGTPKSNRTRQVPIVRPLAPLLEELIAGRDPTDLVFTTANGLPWRSSNFRRDGAWTAATQVVGVSGFRIHDLRHTAASLMIASGASVVDVASVLGHASSHTTLTAYAHLIGGRLDDVSDRLTAAIQSGCGQNMATAVRTKGLERD
jgi:integrase